MRRLRLPLLLLALASAGVAGAARHDDNSSSKFVEGAWTGSWTVTIGGRKLGALTFRPVSDAAGRAAANSSDFNWGRLLDDCPAIGRKTEFYRGRYDYAGGGEVLACTRRETELVGRFYDVAGEGNKGEFRLLPSDLDPPTWRGDYTLLNRGDRSPKSWSAVYAGGGIAQPLDTIETVRLPQEVRVQVIVKGKPNINREKNPKGLVSSRISYEPAGSYVRATFTRRARPPDEHLLEATETKGKIIHEDVYADGRRVRIKFGVHSGSLYNPGNRRLALLLKADESNDAACPEDAVALLVVVPVGGVRDVVALLGVPSQRQLEAALARWGFSGLGSLAAKLFGGGPGPCKLHAHGWEEGSGGVTVNLNLFD